MEEEEEEEEEVDAADFSFLRIYGVHWTLEMGALENMAYCW